MAGNEVLANILGTIGTILWCIQLGPQIRKNYRKKDTAGLPASMILIWAVSSIPFGAYAIVQDFTIPLILEPQIFAFLALITYGQILRYDRRFTVMRTAMAVTGLCIAIGAAEMATVLFSEYLSRLGIIWHLDVLAIFAAILFISGFVPAFVEIYKRCGRVAGISFGFIVLDSGGALFSLAALSFQTPFDLDGSALYVLVLILELSIALSHIVWLWRTRHLRAKAKLLGITFEGSPGDDLSQQASENRLEADEAIVIFRPNSATEYGTISAA